MCYLVLEFGVPPLEVLDIETPEQTDRSVLLDTRVFIGQTLHMTFEMRSQFLNTSNDVILNQILDILVCNSEGDWVSLISGSPAERLVFEIVHDFFTACGHRKWNCCPTDTFRSGNNIGHDTIVVLETK